MNEPALPTRGAVQTEAPISNVLAWQTPAAHRTLPLTSGTRATYMLCIATGFVYAAAISGGHSYWTDEIFSVGTTRHGFVAMMTQSLLMDVHPYLYNVLLFLWIQVFGAGEPAVRTLSLVFFAALMYYLLTRGRELLGDRIVYPWCAIIACSFGFATFGQDARSYALLYFLSTVAMVELLYQMERKPNIFLPALVLLGWTHAAGIIFAAILAAIHVLWQGLDWKRVQRASMAMGLGLVPFLTVVIVRRSDPNPDWSDWVPMVPGSEQLANALHYLIPIGAIAKKLPMPWNHLGFALFSAIFLAASWGCARWLSRHGTRTDYRRARTGMLAFLAFVALTWALSFVKPMQLSRAMLACAPAVGLAGAVFLGSLPPRRAALLVFTYSVISLTTFHLLNHRPINYARYVEGSNFRGSTWFVLNACNAGFSTGYIDHQMPGLHNSTYYLDLYRGFGLTATCRTIAPLSQTGEPAGTIFPDVVLASAINLLVPNPTVEQLWKLGYRWVALSTDDRPIDVLASPRFFETTGAPRMPYAAGTDAIPGQ